MGEGFEEGGSRKMYISQLRLQRKAGLTAAGAIITITICGISIILAGKCDEPAASTEPEAGPGWPPDPRQLHGGRGGRGGAGEDGGGQPRARRRGRGHAECGRGCVPRGGGARGGH